MNALVERLIQKHKDFTSKARLQLINIDYSPEFGGSVCLKYANDEISLMITMSRDGLCYNVGVGDLKNENWYSVDIIMNYLSNNSEYRKMKSINEFLFIQENYDKLSGIFYGGRREKTLEKLHELEKSRSKKLFGTK